MIKGLVIHTARMLGCFWWAQDLTSSSEGTGVTGVRGSGARGRAAAVKAAAVWERAQALALAQTAAKAGVEVQA